MLSTIGYGLEKHVVGNESSGSKGGTMGYSLKKVRACYESNESKDRTFGGGGGQANC